MVEHLTHPAIDLLAGEFHPADPLGPANRITGFESMSVRWTP